ncbi:TRAP transporter substrate-binding protein [Pelagibius litoralis]|uniref:TRAP transporter substrate-binding protein n=1 Tax=Pelagibius litoralis TaxID=374515 RepID=A0A967KAA3_9PROT|nr:TRAP transporter substrate-binding protein [Pelagibius litoralis]NIA69749.1 TRAP transporter substrate-binding protein [Pelagibius litoralis]
MKKTYKAAFALLILASLAFLPAREGRAEVVMKLASATINDVQHEWQKVFAEELAARVGDKVKVEIYPASQLGTIPRMVEGVLLGTVESFITPTAFLPGTDPRFQIYDAPGVFDSPEHVARVIHDPAYRDHLETLALDKGIRVIGAVFNSPMLLLSRQPVRTLDDLKGLKIRTFASPLQIDPLKDLGASPLPLALSEVVPALQSGNIDGMLAGMPILTAFKFYDVATDVTNLQSQQIVSVNVVGEAWFQAQTPEVREAIRAAGRAAEQAVLPWGIANVERSNKAWVENGGQIIDLPADDRARMMARFAEVGGAVLRAEPSIAEEYDLLLEVIEQKR